MICEKRTSCVVVGWSMQSVVQPIDGLRYVRYALLVPTFGINYTKIQNLLLVLSTQFFFCSQTNSEKCRVSSSICSKSFDNERKESQVKQWLEQVFVDVSITFGLHLS